MARFVSRREFLNLLAATGGTAAALKVGAALNLLPGSAAASLDLLNLGNNQRKVAILVGVSPVSPPLMNSPSRVMTAQFWKPLTAVVDASSPYAMVISSMKSAIANTANGMTSHICISTLARRASQAHIEIY